mmetsp:Transcript_13256/g.48273  ORF Transcript_13256/g.48273 Transcript_13256/m.48273 type:complete len:479 (-) Transcript_13256:1483-2919(-)
MTASGGPARKDGSVRLLPSETSSGQGPDPGSEKQALSVTQPHVGPAAEGDVESELPGTSADTAVATRHKTMVSLLCVFIFLLEFKPSEPHLTVYLQEKEGLTLTEDQVNDEVYPVSTYVYFCTLLVSCGACELLGYRFMIVSGALCRLCTRALLLFSTELIWVQLAEAAYAIGSVGEVALFASIYVEAKEESFLRITGLVHASSLLAVTVSGPFGDILLKSANASLECLMWISAASVALAIVVLAFTPLPRKQKGQITWPRVKAMFESMRSIPGYRWLFLWWALSSGVYGTIDGWEVSFYARLRPDGVDFNGTLYAVAVLVGAAGAYAPGTAVASRLLERASHVSVLFVVSILGSSILALLAWVPITAMGLGLLPLYYGCWQFMNSVFAATTALYSSGLYALMFTSTAALTLLTMSLYQFVLLNILDVSVVGLYRVLSVLNFCGVLAVALAWRRGGSTAANNGAHTYSRIDNDNGEQD